MFGERKGEGEDEGEEYRGVGRRGIWKKGDGGEGWKKEKERV